jgi:hypothetical protein
MTEGSKSYGVPLGFWDEVTYEEVRSGAFQLPWEEGFCIKPLQGSKTQKVFISDPNEGSPDLGKGALAHLALLGKAHVQRFLPPMPMEIDGKPYNGIYRIFFGWSPSSCGWIPLGGEWDARPAPHSLIHGALDAVTGPALLA